MKQTIKTDSLPSEIFGTLLSWIDDYFFLFSQPRAVLYTGGDIESARLMLQRKALKLNRMPRRSFRQAINRLEKQGYLEIKKEGKQIVIALTQQGKQEGLKQIILRKKKRLKKKFRCYVSFDIPESVKTVRSSLRKLLKEAGFSMVQLSLWSTPFDVGKEMATFITFIGADRWVHVFNASPIVIKK